jgi:hypothetical protein
LTATCEAANLSPTSIHCLTPRHLFPSSGRSLAGDSVPPFSFSSSSAVFLPRRRPAPPVCVRQDRPNGPHKGTVIRGGIPGLICVARRHHRGPSIRVAVRPDPFDPIVDLVDLAALVSASVPVPVPVSVSIASPVSGNALPADLLA